MAATAAEQTAMTRALALALRGPRGLNPQVGAVILSPAGDVLAEGWHHGAGTPHAEVDALSHLSPDQLRGATAVVTLEPCNHTGRTGPCAQALIDAGVARVVYALDDPGVESGGGADRLRTAGVDVIAGEQAEPAHVLIADWLAVQRLGRPHVTVKWAQSLDGRAAAADGSSQWITGPEARADVHRRRAAADAIVVGTGTVLADDPALTARDGAALLPHQPVPVVIGGRETPADAAVRRHPHAPLFYAEHDLAPIIADLADRGVQRVFVEGGPTLASAFLAAGLVDEVLAYLAPVLLGGPRLALTDIGVESIGEARRLIVDEWLPLGPDLLAIARLMPAAHRSEDDDSDDHHDSGPGDSGLHKSDDHDSDDHESDPDKSVPGESGVHKSGDHDSDDHESGPDKSVPGESDPNKSGVHKSGHRDSGHHKAAEDDSNNDITTRNPAQAQGGS